MWRDERVGNDGSGVRLCKFRSSGAASPQNEPRCGYCTQTVTPLIPANTSTVSVASPAGTFNPIRVMLVCGPN